MKKFSYDSFLSRTLSVVLLAALLAQPLNGTALALMGWPSGADAVTESIGSGPAVSAATGVGPVPKARGTSYTQLMRKLGGSEKAAALGEFDAFIEGERERLDELRVSSAKQRKFFDALDVIARRADEVGPTKQSYQGPSPGGDTPLRKPSSFSQKPDVGRLRSLKKARLNVPVGNVIPAQAVVVPAAGTSPGLPGQTFAPEKWLQGGNSSSKNVPATPLFPAGKRTENGILDRLLNLFSVPAARAVAPEHLPALSDLRGEDVQVRLSFEIRDLAATLNHNPVDIFNFLRDTVTYEPYYGAKKGGLGCLREKVCNDADFASLAISLLRASSIPARYRRGIVLFKVEQLKNLLGVEEAKTAFSALARNNVPIFVLSEALDGVEFADADFSQERQFGVEWTYTEFFYEYDERRANFSNGEGEAPQCDFSAAELAVEAFHACLNESPKKQWIPLDGVVRPYTSAHRDILADAVNFNGADFWNRFLQQSGPGMPLEKYIEEVERISGRRVQDNLSGLNKVPRRPLAGISMTPPFEVVEMTADENGVQRRAWEIFSSLPNELKQTMRISLKRTSDGSAIFQKTFAASEVNNEPMTLKYEGASEIDRSVINEYGTISQTPPALVDLVPALAIGEQEYRGVEGAGGAGGADSALLTSIGESLVLEFSYEIPGAEPFKSQKFSLAGNEEGIFISFGAISENLQTDDPADENRNSHILLEGNAELSRQYLKRLFAETKYIADTLDYGVQFNFARAVVTQNRITREVEGSPTTFDFKGLTIDAESLLTDYSRHGRFDTRRDDFRLLHGLQASFLEGRIFEEIAGLESISTVKGIQYAYAHPENYTMYRITAENAAQIGELQFSENTKQRMREAVTSGGWILTPNKPVEMGTFRGVLYVAYVNNCFNYAIGEQAVANGGWTAVDFLLDTYEDEEGRDIVIHEALIACALLDFFCRGRELLQQEIEVYFTYQETRKWNSSSLMCSMGKQQFDRLLAQPEWNRIELGYPCFFETVRYGRSPVPQIEHSVLLASEKVKFYSPNQYNKWVSRGAIAESFNRHAKPGTPIYIADLKYKDGTFIHNIELVPVSTALQEIIYDPLNEQAHVTHRGIRTRIDAEGLSTLGYPVGDEQEVRYKENGSLGFAQEFIGGLAINYFSGDTYFVPAVINTVYQQNGGPEDFGLPISEATVDGNNLFQDFENAQRILWNSQNGSMQIVEGAHKWSIVRDFQEREYEYLLEGLLDGFAEMDVYGVAINFAAGISLSRITATVIKKIIPKIVTKFGVEGAAKLGGKFIPLVGWAFAGATVALAIEEDAPLLTRCRELQPVEFEGQPPAYYCGKLGANLVFALAGITMDWAGTTALNKFGVATRAARAGKMKLFANVRDEHWEDFKNIISGSKNRTAFFENISGLDKASHLKILSDKKMLKHLADEANDVYARLRITSAYDAEMANGRWRDFAATPPYKPGTTVTELLVPQTGAYNKLVRFHGSGNQLRSWVLHEKDIPYRADGKIDLDRLKRMWNIRNEDITNVSRYNPQAGDRIAVGQVNNGDPNVMQYEVVGLNDLPENEQLIRFSEEKSLSIYLS